MSGLKLLYNFILKDVVKRSGQASGIMSIGGDVRKLANKKFQSYVMTAQKQGVDLDKLSEQEIKYMLELNKPKPIKAISADSPEGKRFTHGLMNMLNKASGENVIKTDFGGGITDDVSEIIIKLRTMEPMDSMKEANKVLKGEGRYKSLSKADREKIAMDESVTDHIFERDIKPDPEDFAHGGRTGTGLNYLLGEDDQNSRVPFGLGGFNKARRAFLKAVGAGAAGVGAAKSGLLSIFKGGGKKEVIKELTQVPIKNIEGMPAWFKPLVNKVIKEGEEVSGDLERIITHKTTLPGSKTDIYVTQDLNTGDVIADIGMSKHGWADGKFGQPVRLEYKASELIEPDLKTGKGGTKTKEEFNVEEAEFTGGHPENVKFEESTINKFGEHESDFSEVEEFATGLKKGKGGSGQMASGGRVPLAGGLLAKLGKFSKAEVLIKMMENTIKGSKDAYVKKTFPNFIKELKAKPELANDPKVWNFFTNKLPKNQRLVVHSDDTVDFWKQSDYGPHNIETTTKFHEKHPYLTRDQAIKIQNMEPEDQILEMKRLETIRNRTKQAYGGIAGMLGE